MLLYEADEVVEFKRLAEVVVGSANPGFLGNVAVAGDHDEGDLLQ
jgi:hypothetical protein